MQEQVIATHCLELDEPQSVDWNESVFQFSQDGSLVLNTCKAKSDDCNAGFTARIWCSETGNLLRQFPPFKAELQARPAFNPDGTKLAYGCWPTEEPQKLNFWVVDTVTGEWAFRNEDEDAVSKLIFSPDSDLLFAANPELDGAGTDSGGIFDISVDLYISVDELLLDLAPDRLEEWDVQYSPQRTVFDEHSKRAVVEYANALLVCDVGRATSNTSRVIARIPSIDDVAPDGSAVFLALSPDGKFVVTFHCDDSGIVEVIDLWRQIKPNGFGVSFDPVVSEMVLSQDGQLNDLEEGLHSAPQYQMWSTSEGQKLFPIGEVGRIYTCLEFSPDSNHFLAIDCDCHASLLSSLDGQAIVEFEIGDYVPIDGIFSPDGSRVLIRCKGGVLTIWNCSSGLLESVLRPNEVAPDNVTFTPDGGSVFALAGQKLTKWQMVESDKQLIPQETEAPPSSDSKSSRLSKNARKQFGRGWLRRAIDGPPNWLDYHARGNGTDIVTAAFDPTGQHLLVACKSGHIELQDAASGLIIRQFPSIGTIPNQLLFSPNGCFVAVACADSTLLVWDMQTSNLTYRRQVLGSDALPDRALAIYSFDPEGKQICFRTGRGIELLNFQSEAEAQVLQKSEAFLQAKYSGDGSKVMTLGRGSDYASSAGLSVSQWDIASQVWIDCPPLTNFRAACQDLVGVDLSNDGSQLLAVFLDGGVLVWNTLSGQQIAHIENRNDEKILYARFNRSASHIFGMSQAEGQCDFGEYPYLRHWDLTSHKDLLRMQVGLEENSRILCLDPHGRRVVTQDVGPSSRSSRYATRMWEV